MKMSELRRQHPLLILFDTARGLRSNLGMALVLAISLPGDLFGGFVGNLIVISLAIVGVSLLYSVMRWFFYHYSYEEGVVHIREGVLFKRERSISWERVQSINVLSNVLQQAFGLATLQIKTAGVNVDAEVNLRALSTQEVENIRRSLNKAMPRPDDLMEVPRGMRFLQGRDLWLAGVTSGRFMILFSVIALIYSQLYEYIPQDIMDQVVEGLSHMSLLLWVLMIAGMLLVSWALSTVTFAIQYARFTVNRFEDRLEISWGVIKRNHVTVRLHRLQALVIHQGLLRQPLGLCTLLVEVAGGGSKEKERVSILHPLVRRAELEAFLHDILPEYSMPGSMTPLPRRSLRRYLFRAMMPAALAASAMAAAGWYFGLPHLWTSFLLLVPAALLARSRYANGSSSVDGMQLSLRFRGYSLYHVLIGRSHVQSLTLKANPFQRLAGLRSLSASLLSSPAGRSYTLKDLEASEAQAIRDWYSRSE